ncbi:IS630 family transposase [Streptomyces sp. HC307]|uniref:IS630 family transposase n=1 Tax=Streptomyces flavusporus TaxID=3385496 RepID=UPI00391723DE
MSELVGDARQLPPSAQEALRLRAVAALVAGRDREDVAALFKVSLKAVDNWWAKWLAGGREALVARPRGRRVGEHQLLGEVEQQAVRQAVLDHRPCDLGLAGQLWTRAGVGDLIAKLYRVRLTGQGVGTYLRRWGLSFQRPDKRAVEQDAEAVRVWREETWRRSTRRLRVVRCSSPTRPGIRSDQVTGRTWGARGCTPVVRRMGNRFSVNAMSAISTKGRMHFMVFTETFDADVMCRFLDRLAGHFDRKVHLVLDGRSAHRSRKVRAWLAEHPDLSVSTRSGPAVPGSFGPGSSSTAGPVEGRCTGAASEKRPSGARVSRRPPVRGWGQNSSVPWGQLKCLQTWPLPPHRWGHRLLA